MATAVSPRNFVGGEWVDAAEGVIDVLNPATGESIATVPNASAAEVDRAVRAAEAAFDGWADHTPLERATLLNRLADAIEADVEQLTALESANVGKPLAAAEGEVRMAADALRFYAGAARVLDGSAATEFVRGRTSIIRRDPIGVVAQMAPWNYPILVTGWKLGSALAAGNTTVLKPSELTPLTALRIAELSADILPPGVLNVITGEGVPTGDALVRHPRVRLVSLTGDSSTAKLITRNGADNLKRMHFELGGKAPVIVFPDADLDAVAAGVRAAAFANAGQNCVAATRVLVSERAHDDLLSTLVPAVAGIAVGDPALRADAEMGPVISARQRERVLGFVERAVDGGAEVATGGEATGAAGFFVAPTVVTGVRGEDEISRDEIFGPVVTVQPFDDEAAALRWANGTEFGLAGSVWTGDVARGLRLARKLQLGTVWINEHLCLANEMPHGGFKQSGYGKDMSKYALDDYTVVKHVMVNLGDGA